MNRVRTKRWVILDPEREKFNNMIKNTKPIQIDTCKKRRAKKDQEQREFYNIQQEFNKFTRRLFRKFAKDLTE